jgi:hypothetical protein
VSDRRGSRRSHKAPNPKRQRAFGARLRDDQRVSSPTVGMQAPRYRLASEQDPNPTEQEPSTPLIEWAVTNNKRTLVNISIENSSAISIRLSGVNAEQRTAIRTSQFLSRWHKGVDLAKPR